MDTEGTITFRALTSADYRKLRTELRKQYEQDGRKWLAARKQAASAGEEFTDRKPVQPRYRTLDRVTDKSRAQRLAAAYQKKYDALKKAKQQANAT